VGKSPGIGIEMPRWLHSENRSMTEVFARAGKQQGVLPGNRGSAAPGPATNQMAVRVIVERVQPTGRYGVFAGLEANAVDSHRPQILFQYLADRPEISALLQRLRCPLNTA